MKSMVDIFVKLGERLSAEEQHRPYRESFEENNWFTNNDIDRAIEAICSTMLNREELTKWLAHYPTMPVDSAQRVLIIMAGNIPLVGFFDLLCTLMAGHTAIIKPSHKDHALIVWIVEIIKEIDAATPIYIYKEGEAVDRVIATGGEAAMLHFANIYQDRPILLRGSRHSVAVITDTPPTKLLEDIYSYSGLGCRNVSLIFVPRGYDLKGLPLPKGESLNTKYINNYLQNRALLAISGVAFHDNGASCMLYQECFPIRISTLSIVEYNQMEQVEGWINRHDSELQCIVADRDTIEHPRRVDFGEAQRPSLYDYADGIDTMKFLE